MSVVLAHKGLPVKALPEPLGGVAALAFCIPRMMCCQCHRRGSTTCLLLRSQKTISGPHWGPLIRHHPACCSDCTSGEEPCQGAYVTW